MAINRESNAYTVIFAIIMVTVVGGLLAFLSLYLKPQQTANVVNNKKQDILKAMGDESLADVSREEAGKVFNDYVKKRFIVDFKGNIVEGTEKDGTMEIDLKDETDAFNVDMRREYVSIENKKERNYPVFVCEKDGETTYVVAVSGKGLWDDIWGYIGLEADGVTIKGTSFDHKGETPGLGSKITEDWFIEQFKGKTIAEDGKFVGIQVLKPGNELDNHQVDGISGGTFTSVGVAEMLERNLRAYFNFFNTNPEYVKNT